MKDNKKFERPFTVISILVDNDSWILPFAQQLECDLSDNYQCQLIRNANDIPHGDICFFLGCTHIVSKEILARNRYNLVVHESNLPQGKGFAPMSWQILAGENTITVCLIEANDEVDSGNIWLKKTITLNGSELHDEWRAKQGEVTVSMVKEFVNTGKSLLSKPQQGQESFYPRRTANDSELDINKSIDEQFNLLRIVSNSDYPAFFIKNGVKYTIEIAKDES